MADTFHALGDLKLKLIDLGDGTYGSGVSLCEGASGSLVELTGASDAITLRANYTAAQTNTALVAGAAGFRIVVTRVKVAASKANTVNVSVIIGFHATVTPTGAGALDGHPGIDPGGGFVSGNGGAIVGKGADADALLITSSVPTSGSIDVYVTYHVVPA